MHATDRGISLAYAGRCACFKKGKAGGPPLPILLSRLQAAAAAAAANSWHPGCVQLRTSLSAVWPFLDYLIGSMSGLPCLSGKMSFGKYRVRTELRGKGTTVLIMFKKYDPATRLELSCS